MTTSNSNSPKNDWWIIVVFIIFAFILFTKCTQVKGQGITSGCPYVCESIDTTEVDSSEIVTWVFNEAQDSVIIKADWGYDSESLPYYAEIDSVNHTIRYYQTYVGSDWEDVYTYYYESGSYGKLYLSLVSHHAVNLYDGHIEDIKENDVFVLDPVYSPELSRLFVLH